MFFLLIGHAGVTRMPRYKECLMEFFLWGLSLDFVPDAFSGLLLVLMAMMVLGLAAL